MKKKTNDKNCVKWHKNKLIKYKKNLSSKC